MKIITIIFCFVCLFSSCKPKGWSPEYKAKFIQTCTNLSRDMTVVQVNSYCACIAEKTEKKYPNEKDVDAAPNEAVMELKKECGGK